MISWCAQAKDVWHVSEWLSQTEMEPGPSALLGQMDPHSSTTVNTPCFMSPALLIFHTLFNSSPYNIRFSKPRVTMRNCFWSLSCAVVLWRGSVSGKYREDVSACYLRRSASGFPHLRKFETPYNICHSCFALYVKTRVGPLV